MAEEWRTEGSARRSQHPIASCYGARAGAADKDGRQLSGASPRVDRSSVIGRSYVGPYLDIALMLGCGLILIRATEKFFRFRSSGFFR